MFGPLALLSAALFFGLPIAIAVLGPTELPACDSAEAKQTIEEIVTTAPAFQRFGWHVVRIDGHQEVSFDPVKQERIGRCMIVTDAEPVLLRYTITWQDRSKNMFYLKLFKE